MKLEEFRKDLPVLLIYDLDPSWSEEDILDGKFRVQKLKNAMMEVGHPVEEVEIQSAELERPVRRFNNQDYVVLNWCEGFPGVPRSDSLVAHTLERLGFTFTGASADMLAFSQDKYQVKCKLQEARIPIPVWNIYFKVEGLDWDIFPAIVKPAFEHCSIGITRESVVQSPLELENRVRYVLEELQEPAIVEEFIDGREFHVGVIGNNPIWVLPPGEIDYCSFNDIHDRLCTYESNFDKDSLAYKMTAPKVPAILTYKQWKSMEKIVRLAYQLTGCRDYARMDIRMRDGEFYLLDVNHNADISADTSMILGAAMRGITYGDFGSILVNLAARRNPSICQVSL
jgi:D-alanine-D-alanine ligase